MTDTANTGDREVVGGDREVVELPDVYDFSNGSENPYTIEARHHMIPSCPGCHRFVPVMLDGSDYYTYFVQGKGNIQDIFPYLTTAQREVMMTGIHPECWDALMGPEDEDDEDEDEDDG